MKCKRCDGENVVEGVEFGYKDMFYNVGPKRRNDLMLTGGEVTYCDVCEDCGEIQRFYIKPGTRKEWIKSPKSRQDMEQEILRHVITSEEEKEMQQEIKNYSEQLISKQVRKTYVDELHNYEKHEWYDYPVRTKGPSYRLYREKGTGNVVLIRPSTMNLHKGKYVVCVPIQETTDDFMDY